MSTKYQDKFGYPVERTKGKVRPHMAVGPADAVAAAGDNNYFFFQSFYHCVLPRFDLYSK